jgi:hypothetical protein
MHDRLQLLGFFQLAGMQPEPVHSAFGEHPRTLVLACVLEWEYATDIFPVSIQSCEVDSVAK